MISSTEASGFTGDSAGTDEGRVFANLGPVHLDVIDRAQSLAFWRDAVGLTVLDHRDGALALGAGDETLVVLHPGATRRVESERAGLYHLAIHLPSEPEFARVLGRLMGLRWRISPVEHVMSKAIYLSDPDGNGLEITLETLERMRSLKVTDAGVELIDSEGRQRNPSQQLDLEPVLATLPNGDYSRPMPAGTILGHVNLQVGDLDSALRFYRDGLGLLEHASAPRLGVANFYAGAPSPHLIAVNVWQAGASHKSSDTAGMRHFTIRFDSSIRLMEATNRLVDVEKRRDGYLVQDPAGLAVLLTS